jgi:hypothetical protein
MKIPSKILPLSISMPYDDRFAFVARTSRAWDKFSTGRRVLTYATGNIVSSA